MSDGDERPVILDEGSESELLFMRLADEIDETLRRTPPDNAGGQGAAAVVRFLRLLSARQLAVLLSEEANRHEVHVIHEPPRYTAQEVEAYE